MHDKNFLRYKEQVEFTEHLCANRQDAIDDGEREEQRELQENELEICVFFALFINDHDGFWHANGASFLYITV